MTPRRSSTRCVVWGHDKPRPAAAGLVVCTTHADHVLLALQDAPKSHDALAGRLTGSTTANPSGMPSGTRDPGLSINPRVAQLRTDILNTIASWVAVGVAERHLTPPDGTLPARCKWLVNQIDWYLAQQVWTHRFAQDMLENDRQARTYLIGDPTRRIVVADRCLHPGCDGVLFARIKPDESRLDSDIVCSKSPVDDDGVPEHRWEKHRWNALRRDMRKAGL